MRVRTIAAAVIALSLAVLGSAAGAHEASPVESRDLATATVVKTMSCTSKQGHKIALSFEGTNGRYVYGTVTNASGTTYVQILDNGWLPKKQFNFSLTADATRRYLGDLGARGYGGVSVRATFGHNILGVSYYCTTGGTM